MIQFDFVFTSDQLPEEEREEEGYVYEPTEGIPTAPAIPLPSPSDDYLALIQEEEDVNYSPRVINSNNKPSSTQNYPSGSENAPIVSPELRKCGLAEDVALKNGTIQSGTVRLRHQQEWPVNIRSTPEISWVKSLPNLLFKVQIIKQNQLTDMLELLKGSLSLKNQKNLFTSIQVLRIAKENFLRKWDKLLKNNKNRPSYKAQLYRKFKVNMFNSIDNPKNFTRFLKRLQVKNRSRQILKLKKGPDKKNLHKSRSRWNRINN